MWVQPNVYLAPHFVLSPLGLQHTLLFKNETEEQPWVLFFWRRKKWRPAACRFSLEQKNKGLAGFVLEQKIGIAGAVFLEQKTEASWLDLYSRFG